jgi:hypothetical protein
MNIKKLSISAEVSGLVTTAALLRGNESHNYYHKYDEGLIN